MKKNNKKTPPTYIDAAKFEAIITRLGLPIKVQAGFVKVMGPSGRNLYVANTKRVARVDISGFTVEGMGAVNLGDLSFGGVHQALDFNQEEEVILANFEAIATHMGTLEPVV